MWHHETVEQKVLKTIRESEPQPLPDLIKRVGGDDTTTRQAIVSLLDRGKLELTIDRKVATKE